MSRSALAILLASGVFLVQATAHAADVKISGEHPLERITVKVEEAKADRVLDALRQRYDFELVGLANAGKGDALTVTLSGSLRTVLERLLRNRNHLIVQSRDRAGGIEKVVVLDAAYGAVAARPAQIQSNGTNNASFMQALTGQAVP